MSILIRFLCLQSLHRHLLHLWTLVLLYWPLLGANADCTTVSIADSLNLVALYYASNGNAWNNNTNWLVQPVNTWYGVALTEDGCFVREIVLQGNNLTGNLPQFTAFSQVEKIILANNNLNGDLPAFNSLVGLQELYLGLNSFSGVIPAFSANTQLTKIDFSYNQFSGSLPIFSTNNLLQSIDFSGNQLTGSIPNYTNLTQLTRLKLAYNNLSGNLPNFATLLALEELNVGDNQLSGAIPNYAMPNLRYLGLYANNFSGELPAFENLAQLEYLSVIINNLSGNLPDFANALGLKVFDAGHNQFLGSIPINYAQLPDLQYLNLGKNNLTGVLPDFVNPLLDSLVVDSNALIGLVPNFVLPNVKTLRICKGNNFWGNIPNFAACPQLAVSAMDFSCVTAARISGRIYSDINNNCQYDVTEPTLPHILVTLNGDEQYVFSDENGYYELLTDVGAGDTVQVFSFNNSIWEGSTTCGNMAVVPVPLSTSQINGIDFGMEALEACPQLLVEISTPKLRVCSTNLYTINYCNQGSVVAEGAYLELLLPDSVSVVSADQPYSINTVDNVYVFDLGDINIGQCGAIHVTTSVACGVVLGSTLCAEVREYPNEYCGLVSELWDGARLRVEGECVGSEVLFKIRNVGLGMSDSTAYRIYEDDVINVLSKVKLGAGAEITISRPANGSTYRMVAEQTPYNPISEYVQSVVELCGMPPYSLGFVITQSAQDLQPNFESDCHEAVGSYDPNDKVAVPKGIGEEHILRPNDEISYTIRFQNTGTDAAYRVMLIDTLDDQTLRPETLRATATSHPCHYRVVNGKVLIVEFDPIALPPSSINLDESQGFITFKISQKSNNPDQTLIENFADIYFDYNAPIRTPTVFHTIKQVVFTDLTPNHNNPKNLISLYPNPANDNLLINVDVLLPTDVDIALVSQLGTVLLKQPIQTLHQSLSIAHLSNGIYFYQITDRQNKQLLQSGKVVVIH